MPTQKTSSKTSWSLIDLSEDASLEDISVKVPFMIGRRESADLPLSCISVSGKHAELVFKDNDLWINDLSSTNGTFVNGVRVSETTKLKAEDIVQFGSMVFKVDRQGGSSTGKRMEMQTVASDIPESAQGRFHRLLRVGVVPFFQPVFDLTLDDPLLTGYEVLGRGRLPGLCTPDEMFTAAKEMEKTAELSESLRKRGIEVADENFSSGKMIFVNTHPSEISSDRLGESLARIRAIHPDRNFTIELPAAVLEMPESMAVIEAATEGMNIDLSIYGFHAESIRAADLQRLAPKVVKFSDSLIRDIKHSNQRKQKLVASMVKMLVELDIQPMAEKVETAEEHETVKRLGFTLAQGFYYGRPSSIDDCLGHSDAGHQDVEHQDVGRQDVGRQDVGRQDVGRQDVGRQEANSESHTFVDRNNGGSSQAESLDESDDSESDTTESPRQSKRKNDAAAQWILSQPNDNFTIQIMVTTSKEGAAAHVAKQSQPDEFFVVPGMGTRRHLFLVFHGSFADRPTAKAAAQQFQNSHYCPLVRKLATVQAEVEKVSLENA